MPQPPPILLLLHPYPLKTVPPQVVEEPEDTDEPEAPEAPASEVEPEEPAVSVEYPLCEPGEISLDVYMAMSGFLPMVIPDVANTGLDTNRGVMLMEEATGVNLNWTLIQRRFPSCLPPATIPTIWVFRLKT